MLVRKLLGVAAIAAAVTFGGVAFAGGDDDGCDCCKKKGDDASAKKDGAAKKDCCEGEGDKAAAKKDGCCEGDKAGCPGLAVESKPVSVALKVEGMKCEACSTAVTEKVKTIEGVAKIAVSHETGAATIEIAAGKSVKLVAIEKAIGPKFKLDESAPLSGIVKVSVSGATCNACVKAVCGKLGTLKGAEKAACGLDADAKIATLTLVIGEKSDVSLKSIRALFEGDKKFALADVELLGLVKSTTAPVSEPQKKS